MILDPDGTILTNAHIVAEASPQRRQGGGGSRAVQPTVHVALQDGRIFEGRVISADRWHLSPYFHEPCWHKHCLGAVCSVHALTKFSKVYLPSVFCRPECTAHMMVRGLSKALSLGFHDLRGRVEVQTRITSFQ